MTFEGRDTPPVIRDSRMKRIAKIAVPTTAALGAGAIIANAAIPAADGTISACYTPGDNGTFRLVDTASDCGIDGRPNETYISWNQKGPAGPQGPAGTTGPQGPQGPAGTGGGTIGAATFPAAASDYLLELDGVKGESKDNKHPGTIEIESWSWGATQTSKGGAGGGGGAGKVKFNDISFRKNVDASSPVLFQRAASGQHIKKAVLYVRKAGGDQMEYLKVTLSDVLVSSFKTASQEPRGDGETESISLNFSKIQITYTPTNPDGSAGAPVHGGWDVKANKKI